MYIDLLPEGHEQLLEIDQIREFERTVIWNGLIRHTNFGSDFLTDSTEGDYIQVSRARSSFDGTFYVRSQAANLPVEMRVNGWHECEDYCPCGAELRIQQRIPEQEARLRKEFVIELEEQDEDVDMAHIETLQGWRVRRYYFDLADWILTDDSEELQDHEFDVAYEKDCDDSGQGRSEPEDGEESEDDADRDKDKLPAGDDPFTQADVRIIIDALRFLNIPAEIVGVADNFIGVVE